MSTVIKSILSKDILLFLTSLAFRAFAIPINISDRRLLKAIYNHYFGEFCDLERSKRRSTKNYVTIDFDEIEKITGVNADIVFGRLYYHLDKKYRYKQEDGSEVNLFTLKVGEDTCAIHFPYLSAVIGELDDDYKRFAWPFYISIFALFISFVSLLANII